MTVYTVASSKGGTGKTTTAAELTAELARRGRRVLAIDLDQQGNLTRRLGINQDSEVGFAADVLVKKATIAETATPAPSVDGAWVLAGSHDLADLESRPAIVVSLSSILPAAVGEWDDVVVDTPPALGPVTLAGLQAADVVIAALECKTEAYDQLQRLAEVIGQLRNGESFRWVIPTRYNARRRLDREVVEILAEDYPDKVTPPIREAIAAADAYTAGMPVSVFAPKAPVADDYRQALAAILGSASH